MRCSRTMVLPFLAAVTMAIALVAFGAGGGGLMPVAPAEAQGAPTGVTAHAGAEAGQVVVNWTPAAGVVKNRVGWASEPEVLQAQSAGDWLEAFNFVELGPAKRSYTVKRLEPGVRHAFIVATVWSGGIRYSDWVLYTTAAATTVCPTPTPTLAPPPLLQTPTPTHTPIVPTPTLVPTSTPSGQAELSNPDLVRLIKPALGQITVVPSDGKTYTGTGFVVRSSGLMVTNRHVVDDAETVDVQMQDLEGNLFRHTGRVLGRGILADLAVVQLPAGRVYPVLGLADSDTVVGGDEVIAMGYPAGSISGTYPTVTQGIISSKGVANDVRQFQTTAAINAGNSGGPLVNRRGLVVGVNTSGYSPGYLESVAFAIASNEVSNRLDAMVAGGIHSATYRNLRYGYGYNVTVPRGWHLSVEGGETEKRTIFTPDGGYGLSRVALWDFGNTIPAGVDQLDVVVDWRWQNLRGHGSDENNQWLLFERISSREIGTGAGRYYRLEYRRQSSANDCVQNRVEIIALPSKHPGRPYALSMMSGICESVLNQHSAEREAMLNSFKP